MDRRTFLSILGGYPLMSCCSPLLSCPAPPGPGTVYFVGASFEQCGINWGCSDGPKTAQFLAGLLAERNVVLAADGLPGDSLDNFSAYIDARQALRVSSGAAAADHKISAAILGLSGEALIDTGKLGFAKCTAMVEQMLEWTDRVFCLDYPPIGSRNVPYLTEVLGVNTVFWDEEYRVEYRQNITAAGGSIIHVYGDWQPTNLILPNTSGYPDYHIDSASCKRAAYRIYSYLLGALS
jgi:hypothetical protein